MEPYVGYMVYVEGEYEAGEYVPRESMSLWSAITMYMTNRPNSVICIKAVAEIPEFVTQ